MHGGCRVNPASLLATVGTSNARYVSRVREATECGRARRLAVAVGDFHTAQPLPDSLRRKEKRATLGAARQQEYRVAWQRRCDHARGARATGCDGSRWLAAYQASPASVPPPARSRFQRTPKT